MSRLKGITEYFRKMPQHLYYKFFLRFFPIVMIAFLTAHFRHLHCLKLWYLSSFVFSKACHLIMNRFELPRRLETFKFNVSKFGTSCRYSRSVSCKAKLTNWKVNLPYTNLRPERRVRTGSREQSPFTEWQLLAFRHWISEFILICIHSIHTKLLGSKLSVASLVCWLGSGNDALDNISWKIFFGR